MKKGFVRSIQYILLIFLCVASAFIFLSAFKNESILLMISASFSFIVALLLLFTLSHQRKQLHSYAPEIPKKSSSTFMTSFSNISVTFENIAGLDEIKDELYQIKDFIKHPDKYRRLGASMPGGILFYGPPGTGKTMLAKALAKESGVNFIYASGSEFVEKFVGIGASRIRSLFDKARSQKPCIIFIDEIDSIGATRNSDNNSERDQTLNQLLIELDGFYSEPGITFIAATNRIDILDEALLRPGRFDRHIYIPVPSFVARRDILKTHLAKKPVEANIDYDNLSLKMNGMSGAHIASVVNEAALMCVKKSKTKISGAELDEAIIKVVAGLRNKSIILSENERHRVACHEAAHAIVSHELAAGRISRISILPHGKALGFVLNTAQQERYLLTKTELMNKICVLLAGRCAEELIFNEITTGAENDLLEANSLAESMVCSYGMSQYKNKTFRNTEASTATVNNEISEILNSCYEQTEQLLQENMPVLEAVAHILYKKEVLYEDEFYRIIQSCKKAQ